MPGLETARTQGFCSLSGWEDGALVVLQETRGKQKILKLQKNVLLVDREKY